MNNTIPFYKSPIIMVGISLFFILVLATGYRIYIAFETHPGLTMDDPYKKGQQYAQTLAQREMVRKLGWQVSLKLPPTLKPQVKQNYTAKLLKSKQILSSDSATLLFYRPSSSQADFQVEMKKEHNLYSADVLVPLKGRWDVSVVISKNNKKFVLVKKYFTNTI